MTTKPRRTLAASAVSAISLGISGFGAVAFMPLDLKFIGLTFGLAALIAGWIGLSRAQLVGRSHSAAWTGVLLGTVVVVFFFGWFA